MASAAEGLVLGRGASEVGVERALAEVRAGRPVRIDGEGAAILVLGAEAVDAEMAAALDAAGIADARLVLPAPRLLKLGAPRAQIYTEVFYGEPEPWTGAEPR